jgi:hypothetical protein
VNGRDFPSEKDFVFRCPRGYTALLGPPKAD